jgi:hypothetical protein
VPGFKRCAVCKQTLAADMFCRSAKTADGLYVRCRPCDTAVVRAWRKANPEKARAARRRAAARRRQRDRDIAAFVDLYNQLRDAGHLSRAVQVLIARAAA